MSASIATSLRRRPGTRRFGPAARSARGWLDPKHHPRGAACVCASDLWPYRGTDAVARPTPMGHEYVGIVEETGAAVVNTRPGDFVVGPFFASDNTCPICLAGYQTRCVHAQPIGAEGAQAEYLRVPLADGTLVVTPGPPDDDLVPSTRPGRRWPAGSAPPTSSRSAGTRAWRTSRTSPTGSAPTASSRLSAPRSR